MVQLSMINPHIIFTLFARLKFVYAKFPTLNDFLVRVMYNRYNQRLVVGTPLEILYQTKQNGSVFRIT